MAARSILTSCTAVTAVVMLGACGGSTSAQRVPELVTNDSVVTVSTTAPTTSTTSAVPEGECGPSEENCTPAAVMATVTRYYLAASATRAEAACIVPVLASDAHAVNEAFDEPTAQQNQD